MLLPLPAAAAPPSSSRHQLAVVKGSFIRRERNNKNRRVIRADANGHTPIFFADVQKSIQSVDVGLLHGCSVLLVHWKARAAFGNGFSGRGEREPKLFHGKSKLSDNFQLSHYSLCHSRYSTWQRESIGFSGDGGNYE